MTDIPKDILEENSSILRQFSGMGVDLESPKNIEFVATIPNDSDVDAVVEKLQCVFSQAQYQSAQVDDGTDVYMTLSMIPALEAVSLTEVQMQGVVDEYGGGEVAWGFYAE